MDILKVTALRIALNPQEFLDVQTQNKMFDPIREGQFSVPDGQIIAGLQQYLSLKYSKDIAYRNFSDRIRGPWRDSLVNHFYDHSKDERDHQYAISMKIVALGGDPGVSVNQIPQVPPNYQALFQVLADLELEAIRIGNELVQGSGTNTGFRVMIENMVEKDNHHLDDLIRLQES
jgi:bacterioferritin (cytochrome b1)